MVIVVKTKIKKMIKQENIGAATVIINITVCIGAWTFKTCRFAWVKSSFYPMGLINCTGFLENWLLLVLNYLFGQFTFLLVSVSH